MIFTRDQAGDVRAGKITAVIVPVSENVTVGRLRDLRRRYVRHDEDGHPVGEGVETVADTTPDGDRRPVRLTILSVEELHLFDLALPDAKACGYKTLAGCVDAWCSQHPRSDRVRLVRFVVGDVRDRDRYLAWTGLGGGDYTINPRRAMDSDAPALTEEQQTQVTTLARRREEQRRADPWQREHDELERTLRNMRDLLERSPNKDLARTVRALEHQLTSLNRKLKAA